MPPRNKVFEHYKPHYRIPSIDTTPANVIDISRPIVTGTVMPWALVSFIDKSSLESNEEELMIRVEQIPAIIKALYAIYVKIKNTESHLSIEDNVKLEVIEK